MSQSKYSYDFPENRKLAKLLKSGDRLIIADKSGYKLNHIISVFQGRRKLKPDVEKIARQVIALNMSLKNKIENL